MLKMASNIETMEKYPTFTTIFSNRDKIVARGREGKNKKGVRNRRKKNIGGV